MILTFFSSQILSITIENPYSYVDSIDDLDRKDLLPILFIPDATIKNIQTDPEMKKSMSRALANPHKLDYDHSEFFQHHINNVFDNVSVQQSHVLLASEFDVELIINTNKFKYGPMTHISHQHYYDMIYGQIFRKDMNQFVAQTFHQV